MSLRSICVLMTFAALPSPLKCQEAQLLKLASEAGVPEPEITKAIFEGKILISLRDLQNIAMSLAPGKDMNEGYAAWNKRFGSLGGIQEVRTIVNGKETVLTGKDILLRLSMRLDYFRDATGIRNDPALTYKDVIARLGTNAAAIRDLDAALANLDRRNCVASYFMYEDGSSRHEFDLNGDYQTLYSKAREFKAQADLKRPSDVDVAAARRRATLNPADLAKAINECDALAAHPQDPEATGAGITDEKLNAPGVISACEIAISQKEVPPRLRFQLARGYLAADRFEDAVEQLMPAAEEGHGASLAYLGDLYVDGAPGIEADPDLAYSLLEKAVEAGFTPAKAELADFKDVTKEVAAADAEEAALMAELKKTNPELFPERKPVNPESVDFTKFFDQDRAANTYRGNLIALFQQYRQAVPSSSDDLRDELFVYFGAGLAFLQKEEFDEACPALVDDDFANAVELAESRMDALFKVRLNSTQLDGRNDPQGGMVTILTQMVPQLKQVRDREYHDGLKQSREAGEFDMGTLVYDYGGCSDVPVKRFYQNAKAFVMRYAAEYR